ncbi:MAG: DUF2235 domain-containing protein [Deltaproteobacteria bacterium]|nr:DUF2235 domain-containing protein [Deltaproteobacteria bacterium]MBW2418675.1 DUF2235 domain-containing protein [Deltaproteobacteria bacterium]
MSETRNLVIGCDGTWNEPQQMSDGVPSPTNVVKFLRALKRLPGRQRHHYEKGVGSRAWESLPGGIYGYGLDKRVLGGYRFLRNCFADPKWERGQNRVFIIGFSRGAYTARRLAGLVAHSGIPKNSADTELGWEMYRERDLTTARALKREGRFFDTPIEMVGVWDTVKATNDPDYHDHVLSGNVVAGYHAMAIDERRKSFPVLHWKRDKRVLQTWFAGVHSDVGGGYANPGLSDIALNWMLYRALHHGVQFKQSYVDEHVNPRPGAAIHSSFKGIWKPLGENRRKILKTDFVHRSVAERLEKKARYRPENLPDDPRYWPPGDA